jgi:hypothetical protein
MTDKESFATRRACERTDTRKPGLVGDGDSPKVATVPAWDLGAVPTAELRGSRTLQASLFRLPSRRDEAQDGGQVVSRCAFCGASRAGTVEQTAEWFRAHRAECAKAPELVETATMRAWARRSLARRARAAMIQAHRERKETLRRRACELVERGGDTAAIAATWNREAVRSLAPNGVPWSASSVANLIRSPARVAEPRPVQLDRL